jgi:uncharacterized protein (DUF1501 family)
MHLADLTRREFLRRAGVLGVNGVAAPWAMNLAVMSAAAAQTAAPGDYKAIVCLFLYGGNDYANTVVPYDDVNYTAYQSLRSTIATPRDQLAATALAPDIALPEARQFALAPQLARLKGLFDAGNLGVLLNIGTLVQPTTKAQYTAKNVPLPPKLFSHNDQQSVWQASSPEGATSGWGGRIGDLFLNANASATFTCVSVTGNAVFMSGRSANQYQLSSSGSVRLRAAAQPLFGSRACSDTLRALVTAPRPHLIEDEYARITRRSIDADVLLDAALAAQPALVTAFDTDSDLGRQLQMVARMIQARAALGARRQVFFVSLGGFDNHDFLLDQHPGLLAQIDNALAAFHAATVELGVSSSVTAFTASDFGRTLTSNGDGSDHGWGSHHVVLGGAVRGRRFYGTAPVVASNGPDDVGQGRLVPTQSVDQFAATLGTWFGVSPSDLPLVVPNIVNYTQRDLGFFA